MSELLDIVDEEGLPTGKTVDRETAHRDGIRHRTSHVWLVRLGPFGEMQVLVQKRAADKDSFPGCWDISSAGHIPAGDDWVASALRELKEELGLEARPEELRYLGNRSVKHDGVFHGKPFHNRQISAVFALRCDKRAAEFNIQESEIESVEWTDWANRIPLCQLVSLPLALFLWGLICPRVYRDKPDGADVIAAILLFVVGCFLNYIPIIFAMWAAFPHEFGFDHSL